MKPISIAELLAMIVDERLRLVETNWECIAELPETLELSKTQEAELDRRLVAYRMDPTAGSPWPEVKARVLLTGARRP